MSSLLPNACVWAPYICMGKMLRISNDFYSEDFGPILLEFHLKPPWGRGTKDCLNVCGPLTKMAAMTIYRVKPFKNLQNRGCFQAESLHKSSERGGLPKLLK